MTDMNQSFIRAFAKKDAAARHAVSEKRPSRRAAPLVQSTDQEDEAIATVPAMSVASSLASLLNSESVIVLSSMYATDPWQDSIHAPLGKSAWTPEAAEAAQAVVANVPRGVAAKSTIPAAPKTVGEPHFESKTAVQRIDSPHQVKSQLPKINPAWEVDQLIWPRTCEQLFVAEKPYFEEASRRLVEASQQGMRTLAVCSSRRGEGCSTIVLCIARAAAEAGLRIGILDADFLSDGLTEVLGLEVQCNWAQAQRGSHTMDEHAVQVLNQPLTLLPLSPSKTKSRAASQECLALIPQIAEQFDLLIVDFGAIAEGGLAKSLQSKVALDAALVVRDLRHTSSRAVQSTVNQIRAAGIEAVGIAENFGAR
jgi:Mrp family chromosome partitioning ATPase